MIDIGKIAKHGYANVGHLSSRRPATVRAFGMSGGPAVHPRLRRELPRTFWAWTILASGAATLGGLLGWLNVDNDTQT